MALTSLVISSVALLLVAIFGLALAEVALKGSAVSRPSDEDGAIDVELSETATTIDPRSLGLPIPDDDAHLVLVMSPTCKGCGLLADTFDGTLPMRTLLLLTASTEDRMRAWTREHRLPEDAITFDLDREIVDQLGIESSPTALAVGSNRIIFAAAVPGPAAFESVHRQVLEAASGEFRRANAR